ncbi:MAG: DegV family protein [Christensenellales bacterium]|jgi:DegV family protein with EDD domain
MRDFVIVTDSSCDLPEDTIRDLDLTVLPLSVFVGDTKYVNYPDERDISYPAFYQLLRDGSPTKTSAVNTQEFLEVFTPISEKGKDILYLGFSSALSGTCSAGAMALKELSSRFPEGKFFAVDSLSASLGQGLLVWHCVQEKRKGKTIEQVRDYAEEAKFHLCHWFTVDDLKHLKRGGRVSAATALVGTLLNIKPILHMDDEGRLIPVGKVRGRKASIRALVEKMQKLAVDPAEQTVFICHGDCREDAETAAKMIRETMGVKKDILIHYTGMVIGSHSGPGTLSLFFMGTHR